MEFSFAEVHEAIADAVPEREVIVFRDRRFTYEQLRNRSRRLANYLLSRGLKVHRDRSELQGHESGQCHLALYLYNGNEYLEGMLGAFKARLGPLNVNYRYVEEELLYLFRDSQARAVIYHAEFAPNIARLRDQLPQLEVLIQVADDSGNELLEGAVDYEEALASSSADLPDIQPSPDDLYLLYTGGTTGMPKGVLWRSADIYCAAMGGRKVDHSEFESLEEVKQATAFGADMRALVGPPMMHGAAQWVSFIGMGVGGTLIFGSENKKLDPKDFLTVAARERVNTIMIVGDAFARPILDEIEAGDYDLSSLRIVGSGGAALSTANKKAFLELLPDVTIMDSIGSSETGAQASNPSTKDSGVSTGAFKPNAWACVVSAEIDRVLQPEDRDMGWFAQTGRVPLGYLGDPEKTAKTFPTIGGVRYAVPGDRARYAADGSIEVLGRDSVTINSGGEKIFAEEVEQALKQHPEVFDTVVAGRPSERWGNEVVAIVQLREGSSIGDVELLEEAARHIARYKLPKVFVYKDRIQRSPSGKADYRWAKEQATGPEQGK
ncbi:MAG: acyl-CoA synthetase [bacterium]|nr:acyl-CoA synthetase [bacterium]